MFLFFRQFVREGVYLFVFVCVCVLLFRQFVRASYFSFENAILLTLAFVMVLKCFVRMAKWML